MNERLCNITKYSSVFVKMLLYVNILAFVCRCHLIILYLFLYLQVWPQIHVGVTVFIIVYTSRSMFWFGSGVMFLYHDSLSPSKASRFWWRFCGFIFIRALFVHTRLLIQRRWRWVILRENSGKHDYFFVDSWIEDLFICIRVNLILLNPNEDYQQSRGTDIL